MLHRLTIGYLDPAAAERRQTVPTKALELDVVHRLLAELGEKDAEGNVTLGGCKVKFHNAAVSCLWLGGPPNRVAEEFALRMHQETGCLLADVDCGRIIQPAELVGLSDAPCHQSELEKSSLTRASQAGAHTASPTRYSPADR
jgi:hypothetical protein